MKICVPSKGNMPSSEVDDRFARARYFAVYDTEKNEYEFFENTTASAHGAGPRMVQFLVSKNVKVIVTFNVGANAYDAIKEAGISIYSAKNGTIEDNVKAYLNNELEKFIEPTR